MNKTVQDISKEIQRMSGTYTPYIIFTDWCKMLALSISNACELTHGELWKSRETDYCNTVKRYSDEQLLKFVNLGKMLIDLYEQEGPYDALGDIYMTANCGNKSTGQFFTPFNISVLTAQLQSYPTEGRIELNEPSCGAGGMILATAKVINERGGNAQRQLKVIDANMWLPQNRKRLILIGSKKPFNNFEYPTQKRIKLKEIIENNAEVNIPQYVKNRINGKYRDKPIVSDPDLDDLAPTCVAHYAKDKGTRLIKDGNRIRPYTVREYARLQGFPDWFIFDGTDNDAYRQIGNAVAVPMGYWVGRQIVKYFNG